MNPHQVFDYLLGTWSFTREVPGHASITGTATIIALDADTAAYEETAHVTLPHGETLHAHQRYTYSRRTDGFAVSFHDTGTLFHEASFQPSSSDNLQTTARHLCIDDLYQTQYIVHPDGTFTSTHQVHGPRKNYTIQTTYRRKTVTASAAEPQETLHTAEY